MVPFLRKSAQLAVLLVFALGAYACGNGDGDPPGGMTPPTTGTINVTVTGDGSPLAGVTVRRFSSGGTTAASSAQTNNSGVASFTNVDEGEWDVEVVPPTGYALDQDEDERKTVNVVAGQTATSSFDLVDTFEGETIEASDGLTFSPSSLTISAGTMVRWVNTGVMLHTVTPDGHSEWTSSNLSEGSTFIHTFDTPGTYAYYCQPHVTDNMTGTIIVN